MERSKTTGISEGLFDNRLESQILKTIIGLKNQVKNGVLPVKTITDTFNQGRSNQSQSQDADFALTYQWVGRILSTMGFQKARAGNNSAILWNQEKIERMLEIPPKV